MHTKQQWQAPALIVHGSVESITQKAKQSGPKDGSKKSLSSRDKGS